jgi:hypothetical protein
MRRAVIAIVTAAATLGGGTALFRAPESDVHVVDGRLVGETTGYVAAIGLGEQTLSVSASVIALRSMTVHLDRNSRILVDGKEGTLEDLTRGAPVRVSYHVAGDRNIATVIEHGRGSDVTVAAVGGPDPLPAAPLPTTTAPNEAVAPTAREDAVARPEPARAKPPRTPARPRRHRPDDPPRASRVVLPSRDAVLDLSEAVHKWIEAAKRRNVAAQMALYSETVREFYGRRDVSREQVRIAKLRTFGSGELITDVGSPQIQLEPSGRVAVVRFTKWFVVDAKGRAETGNSVQELRWERTGTGWRIIGEAGTPRTAAR